MEEQQQQATRLAKLETSIEFIRQLLQEIRDDLKGAPTREDYERLEDRVLSLEKSQTLLAIKVGVAAGTIGVIAGVLGKMLL